VTLANIQFIAKMYLYGPVVKQKVITQVDMSILDSDFYGITGGTYANIQTVPYPGVTAGGYNAGLTYGSQGYTSSGAQTTITEF
jgi:hypothetical protein